MPKCKWKGCNKEGIVLACGRDFIDEKGHPKAGMFCDRHADKVTDEGGPEYIVSCPKCSCLFGVN